MSSVTRTLSSTPVADPAPFSCRWKNGRGAAWATLAGELDAAAAPRFARALHDVEADAELIVLDMRNLTFMDSRGMSIVVAAAARLRRDGRRLVAVRGPREVDMVFTLAGTPGAMEFFDLEAAEPAVQVLLQMAPDAAEAS